MSSPADTSKPDDDREKSHRRQQRLRTLLAQAGGQIHGPYNEIVQPISMATTYERAPDNSFPGGAIYARADNPVFRTCESLLTQLEGGADALLFSSGMSAATAVFQTLAPGKRIVAPHDMYWALRAWLIGFAQQWQLKLDFYQAARDGNADVTGAANLAQLLEQPADLLWIETPSNPCWDLTDIAVASELGHQAGALVAVDSTVATPVFTQPLSLGADIVMHSATKALNGHSDVVAGALITARSDDAWEQIRRTRTGLGTIPGPMEAWLLMRGMRTLFARVEIAAASAMRIAKGLQSHGAVRQVLYPGLPDHVGHSIAARQMEGGFGTMLSFRCNGGQSAAIATAAKVQLFKRATSLGSTESLIEHRASIEGPQSACPADLLRLSIGLESTDQLLADLTQALDSVL